MQGGNQHTRPVVSTLSPGMPGVPSSMDTGLGWLG